MAFGKLELRPLWFNSFGKGSLQRLPQGKVIKTIWDVDDLVSETIQILPDATYSSTDFSDSNFHCYLVILRGDPRSNDKSTISAVVSKFTLASVFWPLFLVT